MRPRNQSLDSRIPRRAAVLLAAVLALGSACASTNQIAAFASASKTLADETGSAFAILDRAPVDRNISEVAVDESVKIDDATFRGFVESNPKLGLRLQMVRELGGYSAALLDIATADFRKGIDEASQDLYGSLVSLRGTYKAASDLELPLADADLAYFATAVDAIGNAVVEKKRQQAIREAVRRFNPTVQSACAHLAKELPGDANFVESSIGAVEANAIEAFVKERNSLTYPQRLERIREIDAHNRAKRGVKAYFDAVTKGLAQIAATHQVLADNALRGDLSSEEIVAGIGQVSAWASSVREFHQKLGEGAEQ